MLSNPRVLRGRPSEWAGQEPAAGRSPMTPPKSSLAAAQPPAAASQQGTMSAVPRAQHDRMANAIRALAMDAVEQAKSGHPGLPMGAADIATVLFTRFLKFDPADPAWPDRDRFVLSAGHGSMLIYALLHLLGYEAMTHRGDQALPPARLDHARPSGEFHHARRRDHHRPARPGPRQRGRHGDRRARISPPTFGDELVDHRTYVLASDGDLMEGISQEAIALAGHLKLNKLIVLFDDNGISIDGPLSLADSVDQVKRFEAAGWAATPHRRPRSAKRSPPRSSSAQASDRPIADRLPHHHRLRRADQGRQREARTARRSAPTRSRARARSSAGPSRRSRFRPTSATLWRAAGQRWQAGARRLDAAPRRRWRREQRAEFERRMRGELPTGQARRRGARGEGEARRRRRRRSRPASPRRVALEALTAAVPEMIGGSADLTGSNNTRTKAMKALSAADYSGRFIHYGVREHGMAAAMNGMALHGGIIPYSGTFLVFSDYCRPAIRLAALMGERVIHVMTHDSIGLGEDGPTHQPVEHLAALRAIPNLYVFRPCDAVETVECWQLALEARERPSVLALTRQNLPQLRLGHDDDNRCAAGAYEIVPAERDARRCRCSPPARRSRSRSRRASSCASAASRRASSRCRASSCSRRCRTPSAQAVIGSAPVKVAVEAAIRQGWDAIIGSDGAFVGMTGFGASAPVQGPLQAFRHHARGGRRGGVEQARQELKRPPKLVIHRHGVASSIRQRVLKSTAMQRHGEGAGNDSSGRHQRIRPHRPQRAARHRRSRPQGHRGRRHQRSRPGRDQCASAALRLACTAASPAR